MSIRAVVDRQQIDRLVSFNDCTPVMGGFSNLLTFVPVPVSSRFKQDVFDAARLGLPVRVLNLFLLTTNSHKQEHILSSVLYVTA